jgi:hypothetical protein
MIATTTIIKSKPGSKRGSLRGYLVIQSGAGFRREYDIIAKSGIDAINQLQSIEAMRARHQLAQVAA